MKNQQSIIEDAKEWVKDQLLHEGSGHDWYHIERVTYTAQAIAEKEDADDFIVALASLFHDLADDKVVENEQEGLQSIVTWLKDYDVNEKDIKHIMEIIQMISFKGGNGVPLKTKEAMVVQDADRLDAIGAIGIARTFTYAGSKGQPIYDPMLPVRDNMSVEEYRKGRSSAIHHFYEKLLKLKDLMNTDEGKRLAQERHRFMEQFLDQFYLEWGES
ncbi:HD domain-containing protein [Halalkalibacterium ligniniphilum]|uniref:HD domain-containing protein n=1 Tax=Halalkalibacterium ligniniphilum TaxID=1134413 RepID=UPI00034DDCBF|nr:HD domain-containing protein [Halalkalibacterium ligniniphilum]